MKPSERIMEIMKLARGKDNSIDNIKRIEYMITSILFYLDEQANKDI